jgi:hypothetical protein
MKIKPALSLTGTLTGTPGGMALPFGKYVYQKCGFGLGNVSGDKTKRLQVRKWVTNNGGNSAAHSRNRARFAAGVRAWQALDEASKEAWRAPALKLHLNRFNGFMKNWCLTAAIPTGTTWDDGRTTWDAGRTTWDI